MKKVFGILGLLIVVVTFTAIRNPDFIKPYNIQNIINWTSLFGILSIGVSFVIISGGIDLSIGSVVGLVGCILPMMLVEKKWSIPVALTVVMLVACCIGFAHGLLITKLRLQPFVVTLCGLLLYRGIARWITGDKTQGFGSEFDALRQLATGKVALPYFSLQLPVPFFIMLSLAIVASIFLTGTIYGRYLLALGRNETAASYSGIITSRMTIVAYVICSFCAGLGGILFSLDLNSVQPSGHGDFYELYAIAAAVLGGCSLRGGEGSILGVVIGTALMRVLYNATNLLGVPTQLEFATIGAVILLGVVVDEVFKRVGAQRQMRVAVVIEPPFEEHRASVISER